VDYGRTIYDLSIRRGLIAIGEDMVNLAYEAPVDATPFSQIEEVERRLYKIAESGRNDTGFQRFGQALDAAVEMAGRAYLRDGKLSGLATGLPDLDSDMGGLQKPADRFSDAFEGSTTAGHSFSGQFSSELRALSAKGAYARQQPAFETR
jgi:replicative DNA helicase